MKDNTAIVSNFHPYRQLVKTNRMNWIWLETAWDGLNLQPLIAQSVFSLIERLDSSGRRLISGGIVFPVCSSVYRFE